MTSRERYFNRDQEDHMRYLGSVPRDQRCASGWHVIAQQSCDCEARRTQPAASAQEKAPNDAQ